MKKPTSIQINIPNPCQQAWDDMTPQDGGRFCHSCEKTVIDFTKYTDAQLYAFFSMQQGKVCGRYLASQLNRNSNIPPQPHSKLYKWFVALGMTLVFAPVSNTYAKILTINYVEVTSSTEPNQTEDNNITIKGKVVDKNNEPIAYCTVQLFRGNEQLGDVRTDSTGRYIIDNVSPGTYTMIFYAFTFEKHKQSVIVKQNVDINVLLLLSPDLIMTGEN